MPLKKHAKSRALKTKRSIRKIKRSIRKSKRSIRKIKRSIRKRSYRMHRVAGKFITKALTPTNVVKAIQDAEDARKKAEKKKKEVEIQEQLARSRLLASLRPVSPAALPDIPVVFSDEVFVSQSPPRPLPVASPQKQKLTSTPKKKNTSAKKHPAIVPTQLFSVSKAIRFAR